MLAQLLVLALYMAAPSEAADEDGEEAATSAEESSSSPKQMFESLSITPPGHIEPLNFLMLVSADAYVGPERVMDNNAGFDFSEGRLLFSGELEKGFGYLLQTNLVSSPPFLDGIINWKSRAHGIRVSGGYFRTPFGGEFQIGAPFLDFIERSQITRALVPGRQIGVQIDQQLAGEALVLRAGAFNGNGLNQNDDERLLYIMRFDGVISRGEGETETTFVYGVNGAYSEDDDADLGFGMPNNFAGKRWLAGADARLKIGPVFVSTEGIYGSIEPNGERRRDVYGYHASIGWTVNDLIQVLARYDGLYAASFREDRDLAIGSIVFNFTKIISLQCEIRVPTRGEPPTPGGVANLNVTFF